MLTLTDSARIAIGDILASTAEPETAGLRIAQSAAKPAALDLSIATIPAEGDAVIEESGVRVFLDRSIVVALEDRVLDADADDSGSVEFRIANSA